MKVYRCTMVGTDLRLITVLGVRPLCQETMPGYRAERSLVRNLRPRARAARIRCAVRGFDKWIAAYA